MCVKPIPGRYRPSLTTAAMMLALMVLPLAPALGDDKPKAQRVMVERVGALERPLGGGPSGIAVAGKYAYVCGHQDGLRIVDVSDPRNPREISTFRTIGRTRDVAVQGKYAFLANEQAGLLIVDVSDPKTPKEIGDCPTRGIAYRVAVLGNYAFVADGRDSGTAISGLRIVDVSDPKSPKLVGSFEKPNHTMGVAVRGKYVYVADKASTLWVVDVSDPTKPEFVSSLDVAEDFYRDGEPQGLVLAGNYAYLADDDSAIHIVDISNPKEPRKVSSVSEDTGDFGEAVAVAGNYAYVADSRGLILVYDISKPEQPIRVANFDVRAAVSGLTVSGDHVFVNVSQGYLVILRTLSGDADIKRAVREHIRYGDKLAQANLVRIGAAAVPDLIEAQKSELPHVRAVAAIVLRGIEPNAADVVPLADALLDTFKEPRSSAQVYAARALGGLKLPDPKATEVAEALLELSRNDHPTAAEALGRLGAHRENTAVVVPLLIAAFKDKDWQVRWTAATAFRQITPTEADTKATVAPLIEALKDENAKVRRAAGLTLNVIDPEAAKRVGVP